MRSPPFPFQYTTPRFLRRTTLPLLYFAGSKDQISLPVAAFSATALRLGVVMYITPSTTIGLACIVERWFASPVLYSHAGWRRCTLAAWICARAEYWLPLGSPR